MASTKPSRHITTFEKAVCEFVGHSPTSSKKHERFNDLHVVDHEGVTWMSNALWIARPSDHFGLQLLIKKFPELRAPGRWRLDRAGAKWAIENIGEPSTALPGYLTSAHARAHEVLNGTALRQKAERLGSYPYSVEFRSQGDRLVWPLESADIHRSQYGYVNGLYARALQDSFEASYFLSNHWDNDYVINQGWTTPFELGSSGIHVFAHWHNLHITAQSTVHGVKSGQARIIDSFLVEHSRDRLPS